MADYGQIVMPENLKSFMFKAGLSNVAMAEILGISPPLMSQITKGSRRFTERHLYLLNQAYPSLNVDWLKTGKGPMFLPETLEEYITSEPEAAYKLVNDAEFELTEYIKELETGEQTDETKAALKQMYILLGRVQATKKKGE